MMESLIAKTDLPQEFGLIILLFALVLFLAPWLSSTDFGFLKIPAFSGRIRQTLRILGPITFVLAVAIHLPLFPAAQPDDSQTLDEVIGDADLHDLLVGFAILIPTRVETNGGLRQYWSSWVDDCTFVLVDRRFDPATEKMKSLDTYTISFSDVLIAKQHESSGMSKIELRFFAGRGAKLVRQTTNLNAPNPFVKKTRSVLVVDFLVDDPSKAIAYAKEIVRRCTKP